MRDFRKLDIWKDSVQLATMVYELSESFPQSELYGLTSQVRRASVSMASNIAEGCKGGNKELIHYLNIAMGSSFELETQFIIANNIKLIDNTALANISSVINTLQKRINAFRNSIKAN